MARSDSYGGVFALLKLRVHPLCFLALFVYTILGGVREYAVALVALGIHELSHAAVARFAGAEGLSVTLTPYGAMMTSSGEIPRFGAVLAAGPLSNLLLASISLFLCWLFPELYGFLKGFLKANVAIATVNLLPAYPLDGGRLCRALFPLKGVRIATALCTLLVALAASVFAFFFRNPSLFLFGGFMLSYFFAFCLRRATRCDASAPLYTLARSDDEGCLLPAVVRKKGKKPRRLTPYEITSLCLTFPRDLPIGEALDRRNFPAKYK